MKCSALILWLLTVFWTEATHWKKQAESVKQFKTIIGLLQSDQLWLKLMQIWHLLIKTRNCIYYQIFLQVSCASRTRTAEPYYMDAYMSTSSLIICRGLVEAAIISYKQALQLRQDFPEVTSNLLHTLQVCGNSKIPTSTSSPFI